MKAGSGSKNDGAKEDGPGRPGAQGPLLLPATVVEQVLSHMRSVYPQEGCGLLAGAGRRVRGWFPCRNVHPDPLVGYEASPEDILEAFRQIERRGWQLLAICHSHPQTAPVPSDVDVGQAYYPEALYLIWSLADRERPELRGYWIRDGRVTEHPIRIV